MEVENDAADIAPCEAARVALEMKSGLRRRGGAGKNGIQIEFRRFGTNFAEKEHGRDWLGREGRGYGEGKRRDGTAVPTGRNKADGAGCGLVRRADGLAMRGNFRRFCRRWRRFRSGLRAQHPQPVQRQRHQQHESRKPL